MLITSVVSHVLFDAKQRYVKGRNINDIVESNFVSIRDTEFDGSDTFNR